VDELPEDSSDVSGLLTAAGAGDARASARLVELVYGELRGLAGSYARGREQMTLQATAIVHEAFVKLVDASPAEYQDRAHFFAVAATAMRQVLSDHARARSAQKRGGAWDKVSLDPGLLVASSEGIDLVALDEALTELALYDERKHRVVELRFFGGLTVEEVAGLLGVSTTTIESEWRAARAWLAVRLKG
jgi:RNA polymerase sigma-70 factor, ECF subfamily